MTKKCIKCQEEFPETKEYFFRAAQNKSGLMNTCKTCDKAKSKEWRKANPKRSMEIKRKWAKANPEKHRGDPEKDKLRKNKWKENNPEKHEYSLRKHHLQKHYNITPEEYDNMLMEQNCGCAICHTKDTGKFKYFHVDHNHKTGEVRQLLCGRCNMIVGYLEDQTNILEKSKQYLSKHTYYDYVI